MTTNPDKLMPAAISRCVAHWAKRKRLSPNAEALLSAIEMAYAEGMKSATPPKGHVLDDTGTLRKVATLGFRADMPTVLFDNMLYAKRADVPCAIISFFQHIPGTGNDRLEVFRGVTSVEHIKRMIMVLCRNADYFPTRSEAIAEMRKTTGKA